DLGDGGPEAALERGLAPGDVRGGERAQDEREPRERERAPAAGHDEAGSSMTRRAPRALGAACSAPPARRAISPTIASPRPREPRGRLSAGIGALRPGPSSDTSMRTRSASTRAPRRTVP